MLSLEQLYQLILHLNFYVDLTIKENSDRFISDITSLANGSVHAQIQLDQRTIAEVSSDRPIYIIFVIFFTRIDGHFHFIKEMLQID